MIGIFGGFSFHFDFFVPADIVDQLRARRIQLLGPEVQQLQQQLREEEALRATPRDDPVTSWQVRQRQVQLRDQLLRQSLPELHPEVQGSRNFYLWVVGQNFGGPIIRTLERI